MSAGVAAIIVIGAGIVLAIEEAVRLRQKRRRSYRQQPRRTAPLQKSDPRAADLCARPGCGDRRDLHDRTGHCHARMGACLCIGFIKQEG